MNNPRQTPLEKLISDRQRIQQACAMQEEKLNADFSYMQENAGPLLLSGLSTLLFHNPKTQSKETDEKRQASPSEAMPASLGIADYLSVAQSLLPVAWEVARPLLTAWGIQKAQTWIIRKIFRKRNKPNN